MLHKLISNAAGYTVFGEMEIIIQLIKYAGTMAIITVLAIAAGITV
jgi:hypothetical protein